MAHISHKKLWEREFENIVSKRVKLQDLKYNQLKLELHDTYEKDEKIKTIFEPIENSYVINKVYLEENLLKINGHISYKEKDYNELKSQNNKQSEEQILIQRAVETTVQVSCDKGLFDNHGNADKVLEDFFYNETKRGFIRARK